MSLLLSRQKQYDILKSLSDVEAKRTMRKGTWAPVAMEVRNREATVSNRNGIVHPEQEDQTVREGVRTEPWGLPSFS